ncbi:MAG: hypothetical protein ACI9WU_005177 [Myxococcota bacterium]|jgi:hypothetical protein
MLRPFIACLLLLAVPTTATASDDGEWFAQVEGNVSIFSVAQDKSLLASQFGYGFNGGYRWGGRWAAYLRVEHNMWLALANELEVVTGAVNVGLGGEFVFADGLMRTAIAMGPSILAFDSALDEAGEVGFFLDVRTLGLRWSVHDHVVVGLDPLTFALVMPVLGGIPIIEVQYRTSVYVEGHF